MDEEEESLLQEVIRIYQKKSGKFVSYMEYSDQESGIWHSKIFVSDELDLAEIKEGLTRTGYDFGGLRVNNVPSKILGVAIYHAVENLETGELDVEKRHE